MAIFEFVLVMVSLILAIGLTRMLGALSTMISNRHERRLEWFSLTWIATFFLYVPAYWWSLWDFREVEWTFPAYFYLLLMPTMLFLAISLFVQSGDNVVGLSRIHDFNRIRKPFFLALAVGQVVGAWDGWLMSVEPFINILRWVQIGLIALFVVGAVSDREAVQKFIAVAVFVILFAGMFGVRYLPGAGGLG